MSATVLSQLKDSLGDFILQVVGKQPFYFISQTTYTFWTENLGWRNNKNPSQSHREGPFQCALILSVFVSILSLFLSPAYVPSPPQWAPPPCGISLPTGPLPPQSFQRPLRSVPPSQHRWSRRHNLNVRTVTCNFNNIEQNGMST